MVYFFLENMALIIALMYLALKGNELFLQRKTAWLPERWMAGLFIGFLSYAIMYSPLSHEGMRLDLREAPLFFISFAAGWRTGLIAGILPAIYRIHLGGPFVEEGIFQSIVLPITIGALFRKPDSQIPGLLIINMKRMMIGLFVFEVVKSIYLLVATPATFSITIAIFFFAPIAVVAMGLMLNDAHRNILSKRELETQSNEDAMTRLPNIRAFKRAVQKHIDRNEPLSIAMVDVDYFKVYNDTHGHQKGDEVLRSVGRLLKDSARAEDMVARYGGEEFIICYPGTADPSYAAALAEEFRKRVEACEFEGEELQPEGKITVSIGVSSSAGEKPLEELIEQADGALYQSKRSGRNRVTEYMENSADLLPAAGFKR